MIDTALWTIGLIVVVVASMYVIPITPVISLVLFEAALKRTGEWWANTYPSEEQYSRERYDEYAELREENYWRSTVNVIEVKIRYRVKSIRQSIMKLLDQYYYRFLPFT